MSTRRSLRVRTTFVPAPEHPAPTYPEYAQLLADATEAAAKDGRHVDPSKLYKVQHLGRDWEWMTCVLGYVGNGLGSTLEMHMLLLADKRGIKPPLPQWLVQRRADDAAADAAKQAARHAAEAADMAAWQKALAGCQVEVEVLHNGHARPRGGRWENLGHAVPKVDAVSGKSSRLRRHPAGRAACESETRAKPLDLSGGSGGPATCDRCLKWTPQLRPANPS